MRIYRRNDLEAPADRNRGGLPSLKLTWLRTWKWMVGILFSYWGPDLFSRAFAVSFREGSSTSLPIMEGDFWCPNCSKSLSSLPSTTLSLIELKNMKLVPAESDWMICILVYIFVDVFLVGSRTPKSKSCWITVFVSEIRHKKGNHVIRTCYICINTATQHNIQYHIVNNIYIVNNKNLKVMYTNHDEFMKINYLYYKILRNIKTCYNT